jgi:molybdate transport system substrate-binding protein
MAPANEVGYNPAVFVEMNHSPHPGRLLIAIVAALLAFATASGQDAPSLRVMLSPGFKAAYEQLVPEFERKTGHTIVTVYGASMGNAPDAIPNRLQRGEPADVIILASSVLEDLAKKDKIIPGTQVNLARAGIAIAVRAGAQKPNISTLEDLKRTLLAAKSIAYSDSVSGVYVSTELFQRLGIADDIRSKCLKINGMVGPAVARGDAEIGFQQLSELLPVPGIEIVRPIPPEAQKITMFSGAVAGNSKQAETAKQFLRYLASPEAAPAIKMSGMQPALEPLTSK